LDLRNISSAILIPAADNPPPHLKPAKLTTAQPDV
jgi:hypothetical protein